MFGRTILAAVALSLLSNPVAGAQRRATLTGLTGRVIADGRPVDWLVEVRLDSESSGRTLATAYTIGSEEFEFQNIGGVNPLDRFVLIIEEEGYEEFRQTLDSGTFLPNPRNPTRLDFSGLLIIYLTPSPPEAAPTDRRGDSPVVDLRQMTAEIPDEALDEYQTALDELGRSNDEAALRHLKAALEVAPDYYDALNAVGIEYLKAGRYRDAEDALERARDLGPNDPRPLVNLGTLHFQEGQASDFDGRNEPAHASYLEAITVLDEAIRLDPLAADAHFYMGSALYETGDHERAESLLVRSLELDQELYDAHLTLLNVYTRLQRYEEALGEIEAYLVSYPDSPQREVLENVQDQIRGVLDPER